MLVSWWKVRTRVGWTLGDAVALCFSRVEGARNGKVWVNWFPGKPWV